jgi:Tol biopolymer transport system component
VIGERKRRWVSAFALALLASAAGVASGATPTTELASVSDTGTAPGGADGGPISYDGRFVAFTGIEAFTAADDDTSADVFVRDLATDQTTQASVTSGGGQVDATARARGISDDGRYVLFDSKGQFAANDVGVHHDRDLFVHDQATGDTVLASVPSDGSDVGRDAHSGGISGDGRLVAFASRGHFAPHDHGDDLDDFVRNLTSGKTTRVSLRSDGSEVDADSTGPAISANGRFVVFSSKGAFTPGTGGTDNVFIRNRDTGRTTRVNVGPGGHAIPPDPGYPTTLDTSAGLAISANGRFVTFYTRDPYAAGDHGRDIDVYLKDRRTGKVRWMSMTSGGGDAHAFAFFPSISANGRHVAFHSRGQFTPGDDGSDDDVFVHDRITGETVRASLKPDGSEVSGGESLYPYISGDGRFVSFYSDAQLAAPDSNSRLDVYVRAPLH